MRGSSKIKGPYPGQVPSNMQPIAAGSAPSTCCVLSSCRAVATPPPASTAPQRSNSSPPTTHVTTIAAAAASAGGGDAHAADSSPVLGGARRSAERPPPVVGLLLLRCCCCSAAVATGASAAGAVRGRGRAASSPGAGCQTSGRTSSASARQDVRKRMNQTVSISRPHQYLASLVARRRRGGEARQHATRRSGGQRCDGRATSTYSE